MMRNKVKGFNLIELMIATVIGVSLGAVAAGLLARSVQSAYLQKGLAEVNETTQFIAEFIRHEFYMAGFSADQSALVPVDWSHSKEGDKYDVVAVQRIAGVNDYDCSGAALTVGKKYIGIFYAGKNGGTYDLFCDRIIDGVELPAESLIYGVKRFQVLYGIEKITDGVKRYAFLSHDQIMENISSEQPHVVSIKIGALLTDTGTAALPRGAHTWTVLDQKYDSSKSSNADLNDGHFHRVVEWTIPLKNVSKEIKI